MSRDFIIMRHIMKSDQSYFILEKSTTHDDYQPGINTVRGEIYSGVWGIFEEK